MQLIHNCLQYIFCIFSEFEVYEEQEKFVPSNKTILAIAFAYREYNSKVHAIYDDDKPIEILMQYDYIKRMSVCLFFNYYMNFTLESSSYIRLKINFKILKIFN